MATLDELLAGAMTEVERLLVINWETRTIDIPKTVTNIGVEYDDDTKHLKFSAPRYYHGTDLSEFRVAVGYYNANDEGDVYYPTDVTADDTTLTFTWIVGPHAVQKRGDVEFGVYMLTVDADSGATEQRVGTTLFSLPVLRGGDPGQSVIEYQYDAITSAVLQGIQMAQDTELKGTPGYTPVKGVDYYTEQERNEFADLIVRDHNGAFTNALKGKVSGSVIRVDDVSPVEHTVKARVRGKNLLNDGVFKVETKTVGGITCTANDDGSYTISGENTSSSFITFGSNRSTDVNGEPIIPAGTYTPTPGVTVVCRDVETNKETNEQQTFTATNPFRIVGWYCYVSPNTSVLGGSYTKLPATFFPQLERGSVATEYEPYIDPSNATVTSYGKNLFDISAIKTYGSVTNNGDGTLTVTASTSQPVDSFGTICPGLKAGDVATFSFNSANKNQNFIYLVGSKESWHSGTTKTLTQAALDGVMYFYASKDADGNGIATKISDIQIELGETVTAYTSYVTPVSETPSSDGEASLPSVSPTMTLMTDTPGLTIEAEYSKDINCLHAAEVEKEIGDISAALDEVNATLDSVNATLDGIIAVQNELIGGAS